MTPDARRAQILASTLAVFAEKGIGESRHTNIALAAGIALPTTFHYFPQRTDLIAAATDEVVRFLFEEIVEPNDTEKTSAPICIERILMTFCDAIDTHPNHIRVWLEWSVSIREGLWDSYLVFYRRALAHITRILNRGKLEGSVEAALDVKDAARVIVGLAHMIVQMKFSGSRRPQIIRTVHSLVHGYLERE
jgi:TetR/AcrR family transcriptional regulator, hemagglutinin/protease regulatory protein